MKKLLLNHKYLKILTIFSLGIILFLLCSSLTIVFAETKISLTENIANEIRSIITDYIQSPTYSMNIRNVKELTILKTNIGLREKVISDFILFMIEKTPEITIAELSNPVLLKISFEMYFMEYYIPRMENFIQSIPIDKIANIKKQLYSCLASRISDREFFLNYITSQENKIRGCFYWFLYCTWFLDSSMKTNKIKLFIENLNLYEVFYINQGKSPEDLFEYVIKQFFQNIVPKSNIVNEFVVLTSILLIILMGITRFLIENTIDLNVLNLYFIDCLKHHQDATELEGIMTENHFHVLNRLMRNLHECQDQLKITGIETKTNTKVVIFVGGLLFVIIFLVNRT